MFRFVFGFFLCVVSFSICAQSKGDEYYQQAKDYLDQSDFDKAVKSFVNCQAEYLKDKNYFRYFVASQALIVVYQDTGDGENAEKVILQAEKVIPQNNADNIELHAKLKDNLGYNYLYLMNSLDEAAEAYTASLRYYEKAGKSNTTDYAFELVNRSITYYSQSKLSLSVSDMQKAIIIYEADNETPASDLASNYYTLGVTFTELGDFKGAMTSLEHGLSLLHSPDNDELIGRFHNAIGSVYNENQQYTEALQSYSTAKFINEKLLGNNSPAYLENVINEANVYSDMGDWSEALANYQLVLTAYQKQPPEDLNIVVDLFLNIARITDDLGMPDKSALIHEQALTFASNYIGKNSAAEAAVYKGMAASAYNHGAFDESLNYNFKALSIFSLASENRLELAAVYGNIGQAYDELNDLDLALKYKQQAIDLDVSVYGAAHASTGMAIGNLAHSYELKGDYKSALQQLNRSLEILIKILPADHDDIGITYMDIGTMFLNLKETPKAIENYEKARKIFDGYAKNVNKAKLYNRLAVAYQITGDVIKAQHFTQGAIIANAYNFDDVAFDKYPDKPDYLNYYEMVASLIQKAGLYTLQSDQSSLQKGIKHLDVADHILKEKTVDLANSRDRLELAQLNMFFTEAGLLLMDKLYRSTHEQQYIEKAFYYSERSKANELLSDIKVNRATSISRVPKNFLEENSKLSNRLNTLRQQIAAAHLAKSQSLITELKAEEFELLKSYEALQEKIAQASPTLKSLTSKRVVPAWSEIKKHIADKTLIVSYAITDSAKYIFIGDKSRLVMKSIPPKTDIDKWMRGYTNQVKFHGSAVTNITSTLTSLLWAPVEETLPAFGEINRVIIIPDGALHLLPFESLGNDKYLIERFSINYEPSAAFLIAQGNYVRPAKPSLVAMAPVFDDHETNYVNKSCQRFVEFARKADSTSRAFSLKGDYISPLPATKVEVEKINSIHSQKGNMTKFFLQEAAREELIKNGELSKFDYIHLATHGFVNSQYPELSGLLLTQDPKSSEDGILYSGEILGLTLKADLVTLSACETALGKKIEGEGIRGLTTAFLFAGAKTVVASLWKVADESTSLLMIEFYNQLLAGKDKATALQLAKLSLIRDQKYNHPYYWAPFVQIGDN